jgi:hypothetical protein
VITDGKKKFGAGIIVGVVGTLVCLSGLAVFAIMRTPSVEDVLRKNVQKQSADEQARLGVDCKNVDADLKRYLNSQDVEALSNQHKGLAEWKRGLTQSVAEQTAKVTELIRVCAPIYTRGGKGKLNGLDHLRFATFEVHGELILLNSMLKYQPLDRCDDVCLRNTRSEIQEAISNLRKRVGGNNDSTGSVTQ